MEKIFEKRLTISIREKAISAGAWIIVIGIEM